MIKFHALQFSHTTDGLAMEIFEPAPVAYSGPTDSLFVSYSCHRLFADFIG